MLIENLKKKQDIKEIFIGRQPIFDKSKSVIAYELLFRDGNKNAFSGIDGDVATDTVIANTFMKMGLDVVTGGKRAFINFTAKAILREVPYLLPADFVCVELLETIEPNNQIINACLKLKNKGYMIALDDFVLQPNFRDGFQKLIEIADIIKIDLLNQESRTAYAKIKQQKKVKFLAEKVETFEAYKKAMLDGYDMFQGYFFSKPMVIVRKDIPVAQFSALQILQEVTKVEPDVLKMEEVIKRDVALTIQLLKYMNSAAFGLVNKIHSIQHALRLLGPREIGKWATLVTMRNLPTNKPMELATLAVIRARFCELIAKKNQKKELATDCFFLGLFSLLDAFVDRPLSEAIKELPLPLDVVAALLGEKNFFRNIYEIVTAYEVSNWEKVELYVKNIADEDFLIKLPEIYKEAICWEKELIC